MKLVARQPVEGTTPTIYIGHRVYADRRTGRQRTSRRWYAEFCVDAQHHYESLRTSNRTVAVKTAHAIVQRLEGGQPDKPRRSTVPDLADRYLDTVRNRGRAPRTIQKYELVIGDLKEWVPSHGPRAASAFTEELFWKYASHMREEQKLAEKTCYDRLVVVQQIFKWGVRAKLLTANPLQGISMKKPAPVPQPCFSPKQVGTLLARAQPHEAAIFATMAYASLRFGEVRDLLWEDLLLSEGKLGFIVVRRGGSSGLTKRRRIRRIPINADVRAILDKLARHGERVFNARASPQHPDGDGPLDERRLLTSLKCLCRRCQFVNPRQYKLHTFRHTFASMCARNNISYKYALEWMGHKSSEILDLYYTMYDSVAEQAIATITYPAPKAPAQATPAA